MSTFKTIREAFEGLNNWYKKNLGKKCETSFTKIFEPMFGKDIKMFNGKITKNNDSYFLCDGDITKQIEKDQDGMSYINIEKLEELDDIENSNGKHCVPDILFFDVINEKWYKKLNEIISSTIPNNNGILGGVLSSRVKFELLKVTEKQFKLTLRPINKYWDHCTVIYKLIFTFDIIE